MMSQIVPGVVSSRSFPLNKTQGIMAEINWWAPYQHIPTALIPISQININITKAFRYEFSPGGLGHTRLKERFLTWIIRYIANRSGQLRQWLHDHQGIAIYTSANQLDIQFILTAPPHALRPKVIRNPKHRGEVGYAQIKMPIAITPKIKTRVHIVRRTPKGAYYVLQDPLALPDWFYKFSIYIEKELIHETNAFFSSAYIKIIT